MFYNVYFVWPRCSAFALSPLSRKVALNFAREGVLSCVLPGVRYPVVRA